MRDIEQRAHETQKFLQEKREKEIQDYINGSEKYKQDYWNRYVFTIWWYDQRWTSLPIDIKKLRELYKWTEDNIDRFIPWIIESLEEEGFTGKIEDIFILDELKRKEKKAKIDWIVQNNEELSENIWNLYYDSLASFLLLLWDEFINNSKNARIVWDKEYSEKLKGIWEYLKLSSNHIMKAWEICLPFISKDFPVMKHSSDIKWVDITKKELILWIWNLTDDSLRDFLICISKKINTDWIADESKWRKKLANELLEASKLIENASKLLN